jgi:hypothetical protein
MNLLKDPLYVIVPLREVLDELTEPGDYCILEIAAILDEDALSNSDTLG